jgi:hypothetical protein
VGKERKYIKDKALYQEQENPTAPTGARLGFLLTHNIEHNVRLNIQRYFTCTSPISKLSYLVVPKPSTSNTGKSTIISQCASRIERKRDPLGSNQRLPIFEFIDQRELNQLRRLRTLLDALEQPEAHQNLQGILQAIRDLASEVDSGNS